MRHHSRLRRLDNVWKNPAVYFITTCICDRRPILADRAVFSIILDEFKSAPKRHGWNVGRFVVMPDHMHFFCASHGTESAASLSRFVGSFKEWSSKRMVRELGFVSPVWQKQFFDHLLRSEESYDNKWEYVRANPVRAGLATSPEDWPWAGEIDILA